MTMHYKLGVDIGGTFTDFSLVDASGQTTLWKEATTPQRRELAVQKGLTSLAAAKGISLEALLSSLDIFVHGSTIATNTVIQRNGPKTALICSEGFRDVVYFRDGFKPERYDINLVRKQDFVPRYLRIPVHERVNYRGDVLEPLDEASVAQAIRQLQENDVESVAVALLWSIVNPRHEHRVKALIEAACPGIPVVVSSDVLPMIREWERTCSTVLSAYVLPGIERYMRALEQFLEAHAYPHPLLIMQLNGGCATVDNLLHRPIYSLASGPAAAPIAGLYCAERIHNRNIITIDMGGTSFDVCLIRDGKPGMTTEMRVDDTPVGVSAVEVHSIGAGGGSIAWIDKGGALNVGPQSAGAEPGPACYSQGGTEPTVTDANVVLGFINPRGFLGGRRVLDHELSYKAVKERIGDPLGLSAEEAAQGIFRLVNSNMVNAIKVVSIERGIDPREFTLVVGGGAGAVHGGMLAAELGIKSLIIPRYAGVFCSYGMVVSDVRHDYMRALPNNTRALDFTAVEELYRALEAQASSELQKEGFSRDSIEFVRSADAKYPSQIHELTVPMPANRVLTPADVGAIEHSFHELHESMFSYSVRESSVDLFHWRLTAIGHTDKLHAKTSALSAITAATATKGTREVYFGDSGEALQSDIYDAAILLAGMSVEGPAVVEQDNTTIVVFPGQILTVNQFGDFCIELSDPATRASKPA